MDAEEMTTKTVALRSKCRDHGSSFTTVSAVLSCTCALIVLLSILMIFSNYCPFTSLLLSSSAPKLERSISAVPAVSFLTKPTTASSDHFPATVSSSARSGDSPQQANTNGFGNNTVIAKKKVTRKWSRSEEEVERGLARARAAIRKAAAASSSSWNISSPQSSSISSNDNDVVYSNPKAFYQSYAEMEKRFKVYVYAEGEPPIVHDGPCKDIYSIEGRFTKEMEHGARRFRTADPQRAHVYFMPFSVTWMVKYIYKPLSYDVSPLRKFVADYVKVVSSKHPFWNRTQGADHFMLACHDWGPHATKGNPYLFNTSIRVLCNANTSEGFNPQKDVSLPEVSLYGGKVPSMLVSPPANASRPYLAFFAGGLHGPIRPALLHHWKDRDPDLRVYGYLAKDLDYYSLMLQSKFCLCPSGYEVASPRIVESIYAECVPVILSDHYVLPFSDVLNWKAFSVQVNVSEIPRLKEVLKSVSEEKYRSLVEGLRAVRKHFELNNPAKRFDVFHMILHSTWLRRINMKLV